MKYKEAVRIIRTSMGFTQEQFAELLNVSKKSVYRWERGLSLPTLYAQKMLIPYLEKYGIIVSIEESKTL